MHPRWSLSIGHSGIAPVLSKTVIIPEGDEGTKDPTFSLGVGDSGFWVLGNQDSCSVAGGWPSQRTPRWAAAILMKPSSPAVLGTTCLRSWGPRTVQGVPGLSSLQEVSRGGSSPRLPAPGSSKHPSLGGWPPTPVFASIHKRPYPIYGPMYEQPSAQDGGPVGCGDHLVQPGLYVTLILTPVREPCFHKRSGSEIPGGCAKPRWEERRQGGRR